MTAWSAASARPSKNAKKLSFEYEGGVRQVEPFCHGISTAGHEVLRAFQAQGDDHAGREDTWKLFRVDRMHHLVIEDDPFTPDREGYNPADPEMASIHCRIGAPLATPETGAAS